MIGALLIVAVGWTGSCVALRRLFGPPRVKLQEAYAQIAPATSPAFDHSAFDELLKRHVSQGGWVDYEGLRKDSSQLNGYLQSLASAPFDAMDRDEKLALLINAYNACTLSLILDHYPLKSIKDIPTGQRWADQRWKIGGRVWSLDQIEHEQIRPKFKEPRVHFALVCASVGCPPLRAEAYDARRINDQLEDQARIFHSDPRWFSFDSDKNLARLSSLDNWYGGDFEQVAGSALNFAARYSPRLKAALDAGKKPQVQWLDYDWRLNSTTRLRNSPRPWGR